MKTESHQSSLGNEGAIQARSTKRAIGRGPFALRQRRDRFAAAALLGLMMLASACTPEAETAATGNGEAPVKITNRIDVPEVVRNNLGITFAKVERRKIAQTLRAPGRFEPTPAARLGYDMLAPGRIRLHVRQHQTVSEGQLLFSFESPQWNDLQANLESAVSRVAVAKAAFVRSEADRAQAVRDVELAQLKLVAADALLAASETHSARLRDSETVWAERLTQLEELSKSGAGRATELTEARSQLADTRTKLAEEVEKRASLAMERLDIVAAGQSASASVSTLESAAQAARDELEAARQSLVLDVRRASKLTGKSIEQLTGPDGNEALWRSIVEIEVRARGEGTVETMDATDGAWLEAGASVVATLDLKQLRVRARVLQADMLRVMSGLEARVLPPAGGTLALETPMHGKLTMALTADADERVIDVLVTPEKVLRWARPGVGVEVEITLDSTDEPVLAIPTMCVVRDELQRVFFRRDPNDPNKVIRIEGKFGISDGRWIEVTRDLMEGDEVVLGGVYELKLTGSGKPTGVGHFHADGTWHEGAHH